MQTMRYGTSRVVVYFAALGIGCLATCVRAAALTSQVDPQRTSRNLNGIVTDASHEPLQGAVVQVEDENLKTVRSYVTNRTGRFSFLRVDGSADFKVWASFQGHQSRSRTLSIFDTRNSRTFNLIVHLH